MKFKTKALAAISLLAAGILPAAGAGVAAQDHTVILKADGTLRAAGPNNLGQLGLGDFWQREFFCAMPGGGFDRVWSSWNVTIAHKPDGSLWGCGSTDTKQLGTGGGAEFQELAQLGGGWTDLALGARFAAGVKSDGTLWSWGNTFNGELGEGAKNGYRTAPGRIGTDSGWRSVAAGTYHGLAIKTDGSLWAWGYNASKQLGDGTAIMRSVPVKIGVFVDWKSVSGGDSHTLGIRTDGSLWAWGANDSGQLGDGTNVAKASPARIGTSTDWLAVSAGSFHSLALKADGSLWAWGNNGSGQLGLGDTANRNAPVRVGAGNDWTEIDGGPSNSAGIRNGVAWLWGANSGFQLGETAPGNRTAPAAATFPLRPEITVTGGPNSNVIAIRSGQFTGNPGVTAQGEPVDATITVFNIGTSPLTVGGIAAPPGFSVQTAVPFSLAAAESRTIPVALDAAIPGDFTGDLTIGSNDADESAFVIHLTGKVLSYDVDGDGDGLSDAAEWKLAEFGFRWDQPNPVLAAAFQDGAARAGLMTEAALRARSPDRPLIKRDASGRAPVAVGLQRSAGLSGFSDVEMTGWEIDSAGRLAVPQPMDSASGFFRFSLEPLPANP